MSKRLILETKVKLNAYAVIDEAIERGIQYGWRRAHKHTNKPEPETVQEQIRTAILNELSEILLFD